jgi:outer membrane autotransporter protein
MAIPMKTLLMRLNTQSIKYLRGTLAGFISTLIFCNFLPEARSADLFWAAGSTPATAGSGFWAGPTFSGFISWSTTSTSPATTEWTDGNVAHFLGSGGGTVPPVVTLLTPITAAGINFDPGATAFTIDTNGNALTITGAGIVNTSGQTQTIINEIPVPVPGLTVAGSTFFLSASSAGNVTIINNGDSTQFHDDTQFHDVSTAASATITNNGGTGAGSLGGFTEFFGASTAGTATITNMGGTGAGSSGGFTEFFNMSTAGNATIINNGGTGGGSGGSTLFVDSSDGGTARAITNGNGSFDISGLATGGMGIGSIEGSGNYFLGSKTLTVGGNNLSTTVSGVIQDGGSAGGTGGSLVKVGTGTLTLTGANTYSGGTTISAGTLQLGNGGTAGSIAGNVIDNAVLAFDRSDAVTFGGAISGTGSVTQIGSGTTILSGTNTYSGGTTVSAGTLQAGSATGFSPNSEFTVNSILDLHGFNSTVGSLSGTGTVLNNGATAAALTAGNDNANSTFSGILQNGTSALALTKSGTGTLVLTGANTYTGGTTIDAGTLRLGNGGTAGSITGNVSDNGVLAFDRSDSVTFGGTISGTGSVTQIGTGSTILTGTNTYSGGTTISAGTLQLGNGGTAGSIAGNVIDNGALAFDRRDSVTFAGAISGTGSVTQIGAGTTILTGNNTYTGGTTIGAGTLQLGNGGTTGSIAGNVIDNGVLAFNRVDSVTFGGVISGTGSLVKQGAGTLTLPGANTYTGTTTINAGSLIVDGSIGSQQTFVNAGAFLGGHGTIGGNLSNSGTVGPGDAPGTLTVANNYVQNSSGTLRIQVGGLAPNQHDLLAVNGHVTLGGTLELVRLGSFNLQPGNQIVFLTAQKGISGAFDTVQNPFFTGTIVQGVVTTSANELVLEGTQGSFANIPGLTPNESAVAKMLDSAAGDPRMAALFAFLNSQPVANLPHDLALIDPVGISSINATAVSVGNVQMSNLLQRLANIHGGSTGFSSAGFAISGGAASFGEGFAGVSGPEGKSGPPVFAPTPSNRWGVFVTGLGEFTNVDSTSNAPGYDVNTGGFTLGVDYRLTPNFAIGLTAGYAHTSIGLDSPGGNVDVNAGEIGMYTTVFGNGFYLDAAVSGGPSGYTTRRTALQGTANGNTNGGNLDAFVAAGYDWKKGNLTIGPTASFQYGYVAFDGFSETGSLAPMKFPRQNTESERTAVGAKASYEWKVGQITALPQVNVAWQHEFGTTEYSLVASLASGAGNSFTVFGPPIGRDSVLVGAGATFILNDRVSTYIYYDGEFARTNYLSNNVSGGVRISF